MGSGSSKSQQTRERHPANFVLYIGPLTPSSRSNMMLVGAMGITPNYKILNVPKGEHKTAEYAKINPYQTVPSLVDGDFVLWESRAILGYIANKFGGEKFYPTNPTERANVDKVLYIDATSIQPKVLEYLVPIFTKQKTPTECDKEKAAFKDTLQRLEENVLKNQDYFTGKSVTIADFALCATITVSELAGFQLTDLPKLDSWMTRMKALPYVAEANKAIEEAKRAT